MTSHCLQEHDATHIASYEVRRQVYEVARAMEERLRANDHKNGWSHMNNGSIMARFEQEVAELREALKSKDPRRIRHEGADACNFLLMLLDNTGALDGGLREP